MGVVTHAPRGDSSPGQIDDDVEFSVADCLDDFLPQEGDWVTALVEETEEKSGRQRLGGKTKKDI